MFIFRKEDIGKHYEDAKTFEIEKQWVVFNEWKRVTKKGRYSESYLLSDYRESIRYGVKHKTYDFHFVDPRLTDGGVTDCAFYVIKYMMKYEGADIKSDFGNIHEKSIQRALKLNYDEQEYKETWDIVKSRKRQSLDFGLNCWDKERTPDEEIVKWLREGVERSKKSSPYPVYYCPESLLTFPLAPYYKGKGYIYCVKDALDFYYKNDKKNGCVDSYYANNKEITQTIKKVRDYERKLKIIENDVFSDTIEELYNV